MKKCAQFNFVWNRGLESPQNPQAGKPALLRGHFCSVFLPGFQCGFLSAPFPLTPALSLGEREQGADVVENFSVVLLRVLPGGCSVPLHPAQWLPKPATRQFPHTRRTLRVLWSLGEWEKRHASREQFCSAF